MICVILYCIMLCDVMFKYISYQGNSWHIQKLWNLGDRIFRPNPQNSHGIQEANLGKGLDRAPFEATHLNLGAICGIDLQRSVHHQDI